MLKLPVILPNKFMVLQLVISVESSIAEFEKDALVSGPQGLKVISSIARSLPTCTVPPILLLFKTR